MTAKARKLTADHTVLAMSVELGLIVWMTEEQKNKLVDEERIHHDGYTWKFFDSDLEYVRKTSENN